MQGKPDSHSRGEAVLSVEMQTKQTRVISRFQNAAAMHRDPGPEETKNLSSPRLSFMS